jgi:hypothetical protein
MLSRKYLLVKGKQDDKLVLDIRRLLKQIEQIVQANNITKSTDAN